MYSVLTQVLALHLRRFVDPTVVAATLSWALLVDASEISYWTPHHDKVSFIEWEFLSNFAWLFYFLPNILSTFEATLSSHKNFYESSTCNFEDIWRRKKWCSLLLRSSFAAIFYTECQSKLHSATDITSKIYHFIC